MFSPSTKNIGTWGGELWELRFVKPLSDGLKLEGSGAASVLPAGWLPRIPEKPEGLKDIDFMKLRSRAIEIMRRMSPRILLVSIKKDSFIYITEWRYIFILIALTFAPTLIAPYLLWL